MMFVAAGALGILSYPFAWLATRVEVRPIPAHRPFLLGVLRQHYPGAVLLVGVATGIGLNLPSVFLAPYAAALDIPRISLFFTVCSITVVVARLLTRRWPERLGNQAVIVLGISSTVASLLLFLPVHAEWHLVLPGIGFGFSSAILFPSVVAAGSMAFPPQHRGLGTLLVLAAFDLGQLIGVPVAGILLQFSPVVGLMPYPTLFLTMASLLALVGVWYVAFCRLRSASQRSRNEYNKNWSGCCPTCSQSRGF
jgi:MFS family permease